MNNLEVTFYHAVILGLSITVYLLWPGGSDGN